MSPLTEGSGLFSHNTHQGTGRCRKQRIMNDRQASSHHAHHMLCLSLPRLPVDTADALCWKSQAILLHLHGHAGIERVDTERFPPLVKC